MVTLTLGGRRIGNDWSTRAPAELAFVCLERCPVPTRRIVAPHSLFGDPDIRLSTAHVPVLTGAGHG